MSTTTETRQPTFELEIIFTTSTPLTNADGLKLWERATHFQAIPRGTHKRGAPRTYKLSSTGQADSLPDAIEGLCAQIRQVCEATESEWSSVRFVSIKAEESSCT